MIMVEKFCKIRGFNQRFSGLANDQPDCSFCFMIRLNLEMNKRFATTEKRLKKITWRGKMNYKLIALDMDGTLLNRNGEISAANREAIQEAAANGVYVILATGRSIRQVIPYVEQLNLNVPLIVNNGSEVWRTPDRLLARHLLRSVYVEKILSFVKQYGDDVSYWGHTVRGEVSANDWPEDVHSEQWLQLAVKTENESCLKEIRDEICSWNELEITNSSPMNIEVNPFAVNKGTGLIQVCWLLDIPLSEAIAVGDSLNDLSMIKLAGLSAAMGNAQDAVKQASDLIAPSNEEDGVAWLVKHYLL